MRIKEFLKVFKTRKAKDSEAHVRRLMLTSAERYIEIMDLQKVVYELWKIIDDIDTIDDMVKENDEAYRALVHKKQHERFDVCEMELVDKLYDKYFKWKTNS